MSVQLKPIKTKKIYEEIVDQVRQLIEDGYLNPGDRLPAERELVKSFQVSRSSIREALSALEMMGFLEVRTGEGIFIKQIKAEPLIGTLFRALQPDRGTLIELLEVRKMVEVQAAVYAAQRASIKEINLLEQALEDMEKDLDNSDSISEKTDLKFHYTVAAASNNTIIIHLMDVLAESLQYLIEASRWKLDQGKHTAEMLYSEHYGIYEAIKEKDQNKARKRMLKHLNGIERVLSKAIEAKE